MKWEVEVSHVSILYMCVGGLCYWVGFLLFFVLSASVCAVYMNFHLHTSGAYTAVCKLSLLPNARKSFTLSPSPSTLLIRVCMGS